MLDRMKEILEIIISTATLIGLVVHVVGADRKPWGQRVLHFSVDLVGFLKSFAKSGSGRDGGSLIVLVAFGALGSMQACQYAKPACDVVKVADEACDMLLVALPDGGTERVPRAELVKLAIASRVERLARERDGGQ